MAERKRDAGSEEESVLPPLSPVRPDRFPPRYHQHVLVTVITGFCDCAISTVCEEPHNLSIMCSDGDYPLNSPPRQIPYDSLLSSCTHSKKRYSSVRSLILSDVIHVWPINLRWKMDLPDFKVIEVKSQSQLCTVASKRNSWNKSSCKCWVAFHFSVTLGDFHSALCTAPGSLYRVDCQLGRALLGSFRGSICIVFSEDVQWSMSFLWWQIWRLMHPCMCVHTEAESLSPVTVAQITSTPYLCKKGRFLCDQLVGLHFMLNLEDSKMEWEEFWLCRFLYFSVWLRHFISEMVGALDSAVYLACSPILVPLTNRYQWWKTQWGILLLHSHICRTCCSTPRTLQSREKTHRKLHKWQRKKHKSQMHFQCQINSDLLLMFPLTSWALMLINAVQADGRESK